MKIYLTPTALSSDLWGSNYYKINWTLDLLSLRLSLLAHYLDNICIVWYFTCTGSIIYATQLIFLKPVFHTVKWQAGRSRQLGASVYCVGVKDFNETQVRWQNDLPLHCEQVTTICIYISNGCTMWEQKNREAYFYDFSFGHSWQQ